MYGPNLPDYPATEPHLNRNQRTLTMTKSKKPVRTKPTSKSRKQPGVAKTTAPADVDAKPSKLDRLTAMLRQPQGATIDELAVELDWQTHSVRGAMSGALRKKLGLSVTSAKDEGGSRRYRIA